VADATERCRAVLQKENKPTDKSIFTRHDMMAIATLPSLTTCKAEVYEKRGSSDWTSLTGKHLRNELSNPLGTNFYKDNIAWLSAVQRSSKR